MHTKKGRAFARFQAEWVPVSRPESALLLKGAPSNVKPVPLLLTSASVLRSAPTGIAPRARAV